MLSNIIPCSAPFCPTEGLASGEYIMELRAKVYDSKDIRTGTLNATLTVA